MPPEPTRHELETKLKSLRDVPLNTASSQDKDMLPLHSRLMRVKPGDDGVLHWFCPRADSLTKEIAIFLLRLHAYNNDKVVDWRKRLKKVWRGCADCIRCMDEAKSTSKTTYFGAFSEVILSRFWVDFEKFEIESIIEALTAANITPDSGKSLADVSSPLLYHILSKPAALGKPFILKIVSAHPFLPRTVDWPMDPPPPGYFLLVLHDDKEIRDWALEHIAKGKTIDREHFDSNCELALQILVKRVAGESGSDDIATSRPLFPLAREVDAAFSFSTSQIDIWAGFSSVLPLIPNETFESFGLHRIIMGHLHDNSPHFREVLRCLLQAVKKLSSKLWAGESADYPQVVFDSIKDNPSYTDLILAYDPQKEQPWFLFIFLEYFRSIWDMPIFEAVIARFVAFTCEGLQHERFESKRPFVTNIAMQILSAAMSRANKLKSSSHRQAIMNVIDIHFDFIVNVSFPSGSTTLGWDSARHSAISLVKVVLSSDVEQLEKAIIQLSAIEPTAKSEDVKKHAVSVRRQLWWKVYSNMTGKGDDGVSMLLGLAARLARLDKLSKKVASRTIWKYHEAKGAKPPQALLGAVDHAVDAVNASLTVVRDGFLDAVTKFSNYNTPASLIGILQQNEVAKHLIFLMLSPVEDLHVAAQTFVGQAFDVDVRLDCFREMLKATPQASFDGLFHYVSEFNSYSERVTEASEASKALVRCMTDVLEVLGNSPDGVLKDPTYVKRNTTESFSLQKEIPKLWKAMTTSIAVIFRRTPKWAVYFENKVMTEWMRDALIFARDLLEHRKAFEAASLPIMDDDILASPRKPSSCGKNMVEDLQQVLFELQAWLRLTDMELLYQSFALLKSLFQCFRAAEIKPSPEALAKLSKFIDQNKTSKDTKRISFLNQADLTELEVSIADFEDEDEDEVELVSVSWKGKKRKVIEKSSSPEIIDVDRRVKLKTKKDPVPALSKKSTKSTKQTRLPFPGKSSSSSVVARKPVDKKPPVSHLQQMLSNANMQKREPKFEGSRGPRPAPSSSSIPGSPSSSSSESEDSEDQKAMATLMNATKKRVVPKKPEVKQAKQVERRKVQLIEDPMVAEARLAAQVRQRQVEEARRNAMRLKPDITPLHRTILSWNYDHDGSDPPGETLPLFRVPDSFTGFQQYLDVFQPLLTLEVWSQIVKSKEETSPETYQIIINSRIYSYPWLDIECQMKGTPKFDYRLSETDIVLLRHLTNGQSIMAKVQSFRKSAMGIQIDLRCCTRALKEDPGLSIGSTWNMTTVFSLTTLHREFAALMGLQYYDMFDIIMQPTLSYPIPASSDAIERTMKAYTVNEPQAKAIISAMGTRGFSLIQGPPGTGKTWTICGLVGAYLSSRAVPITAPANGFFPTQPQTPTVQKLLICAPSNAAIDEIAKRLAKGVFGSRGQKLLPKVVRVGSESQININVKDISLDSLVEAMINTEGANKQGDTATEINHLRSLMEVIKTSRQACFMELQTPNINPSRSYTLEAEINRLNAQRVEASQRLDYLRDKQRSQSRHLDAMRRKYRYEILSQADIICTTLSGSGHEQLEPFDFPMVIIDEAAQSIELSSLIPLKYRCTRCVMVGDPQQLPPTVLSPEASNWGYNQSLFVRLQKHYPDAVHLLSIQYRMHPQISILPSNIFYHGLLKDGPDMDKKTAQPWHNEPRFGVYKFFSVEQGREEASRIGHSLMNREECRMIAALYDRLQKQFTSIDFEGRIGVVCMYRSQVQELRNTFKKRFGYEILSKVDFNTVDGFQGQEKDIIILSCVRAGTSLSTVGFLADIRRMNVAITRSRSSLFIFGHGPTLQRSNQTWKAIIEDARSRSSYVELRDTSYFSNNYPTPTQPPAKDAPTATPLIQRISKQPETPTTQQAPEPEVIPLKGKRPSSRKLPKGAKFVRPDNLTSHETAPSTSEHSSASIARHNLASNGEHDRRFQQNYNDSGSSSINGVPMTQADHPARPQPQLNRGNKGSNRTAEQELEAFRRRKKQANNPFLKR